MVLGKPWQKNPHKYCCGAFALIAALSATMTRAQAGGGAPPDQAVPRQEIFSGVSLTSNSIFGYAGAVWAFGRSIEAQGPRVKALTGIGGYVNSGALPSVAGPVNFDGDVTMAQILAGYQWRRGEWTLKAYAGAGFEKHDLSPDDPANSINGNQFGIMGQLELCRNLGEAGWLSLDASYADVFGSYWTQLRLGRRMHQRFSAGVEAGAQGNQEYDSGRAGAFLRLHMGRSELTASGGLSGEYYSNDFGGYAAFGLYRKF